MTSYQMALIDEFTPEEELKFGISKFDLNEFIELSMYVSVDRDAYWLKLFRYGNQKYSLKNIVDLIYDKDELGFDIYHKFGLARIKKKILIELI